MDISVIKGKLVNDFNGIKIGSDTAPKRLIEFINLRCPYCKQWFEESYDTLNQAVTEGKIQRVIKLLDKDKISLQRGNVMHEYIDTDPEKALTQIQQAFETQTIWQDFELEAVAEYAEKHCVSTSKQTKYCKARYATKPNKPISNLYQQLF